MMKRQILTAGLMLTGLLALAQVDEVVSDDDLFAPFRTVYRGSGVEFVDYDDPDQVGSILLHQRKMVHQAMNNGLIGDDIELAGKVTGVTVTRDGLTVRSGRSSGKSISDRNRESRRRQIDRQAEFAERRREEQRRAARIAAARKAARIRAERIADNRRAAAAEAAAHNRLQGRTNANIAKDYYNAGEGTRVARQNAISAANAEMRGPQYVAPSTPPKASGASRAAAMRHAQKQQRLRARLTKPRRIMMQPVVRYPRNSNGEDVFTGRATRTSIHIKPDPKIASQVKYNAPRTVSANAGFMLSPNAVVTTGRDSHLDDLRYKTRRKIPAPVTSIYRKDLTPDEEWELKMEELLPDA